MILTKREEQLIDDFGALARKKGYREETIELALMLCNTVDMVEKYGSEEQALEEVIKLCEQYDSGRAFIAAVGALIGL